MVTQHEFMGVGFNGVNYLCTRISDAIKPNMHLTSNKEHWAQIHLTHFTFMPTNIYIYNCLHKYRDNKVHELTDWWNVILLLFDEGYKKPSTPDKTQ